jgi:hypothetical protein
MLIVNAGVDESSRSGYECRIGWKCRTGGERLGLCGFHEGWD